MTNKSIINTPDAPAAIGPYSQAVKVGNTVLYIGANSIKPNHNGNGH